jgi:hypothetical protein
VRNCCLDAGELGEERLLIGCLDQGARSGFDIDHDIHGGRQPDLKLPRLRDAPGFLERAEDAVRCERVAGVTQLRDLDGVLVLDPDRDVVAGEPRQPALWQVAGLESGRRRQDRVLALHPHLAIADLPVGDAADAIAEKLCDRREHVVGTCERDAADQIDVTIARHATFPLFVQYY